VLVYVPSVIKETAASEDNDLYLFARFFAVSSMEEAAAYAAAFETNDLGKELIRVYNSIVSNRQKLQTIENDPYFTQRLTEAQLAEERAEAEARGEAKGRAEAADLLAELIRKGYDLDTAVKMIKEGAGSK